MTQFDVVLILIASASGSLGFLIGALMRTAKRSDADD